MEYIYAVLLLHKAGQEINEENIKKVLEAAGVQVDEARVKAVVAALDGVNIDEVLEKASQTPVVAASVSGGETKSEEKKEEKKKEEKKEEKKPVDTAAGLAALFG